MELIYDGNLKKLPVPECVPSYVSALTPGADEAMHATDQIFGVLEIRSAEALLLEGKYRRWVPKSFRRCSSALCRKPCSWRTWWFGRWLRVGQIRDKPGDGFGSLRHPTGCYSPNVARATHGHSDNWGWVFRCIAPSGEKTIAWDWEHRTGTQDAGPARPIELPLVPISSWFGKSYCLRIDDPVQDGEGTLGHERPF